MQADVLNTPKVSSTLYRNWLKDVTGTEVNILLLSSGIVSSGNAMGTAFPVILTVRTVEANIHSCNGHTNC